MYSTSVVLCHFISLLYGSLPLIPSFISAFGNALSPDIAIIFLNTHFWSCREFFDKMYVCEWGSSDEECWVFFFFFLVWEGFQYNLVKHNELTKVHLEFLKFIHLLYRSFPCPCFQCVLNEENQSLS